MNASILTKDATDLIISHVMLYAMNEGIDVSREAVLKEINRNEVEAKLS